MYYFPLMSLTPAYFDRNRGAAMGIVLAGSGVGGLVLSPVFHALLTRLGIRWALRVLGIWNFVLSIPISSVLTKRHGAAAGAAGRGRISMALVKRGTFILQVRTVTPRRSSRQCRSLRVTEPTLYRQSFGAFLQAAGNTVPVYFLTTYSISILSYSSSTGSLLLAVNTAVNSVARIAMGVLADRVGRQNTMVLSVRAFRPLRSIVSADPQLPTGHLLCDLRVCALVRFRPRTLYGLRRAIRCLGRGL